MIDKPLSNKFIQIEDGQVRGTIPRDSELRPHVQVSYNDDAIRGQGSNDTKNIAMIGSAINGIPNHVYKITSLTQAKEVFGGGPLVDAIELAWQPNVEAFGLNGAVYAERAEGAGPSTLDAGALHFMSRIYGDKSNNVKVRLTQSSLNNTWTIQVADTSTDQKAIYPNLGLLAHIQYVPNSWTKYNRPRGAKDYARATMEVKPRKITRTVNGHKITKLTGEAGELILHIHDTKQPAILHNNLTNNILGGSTVYESNGSEEELKTPADQGDPNPNAGPFTDWDKAIDLTNPDFTNIYELFKQLQSLPNINVVTVDDHNIDHIPAALLDLTQQPVSIIPNLDDSTEDNQGNIVEPAGIWSTLGDIVDKLKYDPLVSVSADLGGQLNIVSTEPNNRSIKDDKTSAASYANTAKSAASAYKFDSSEAISASNAGNPDTADEFASVASSESDKASVNSSAANLLTSEADALIGSEETVKNSAIAKASNATASADSVIKRDKAALSSIGAENKSMASNEANSVAMVRSNASLRSAALQKRSYNSMARSVASKNAHNVSYDRSQASSYANMASKTTNASSKSAYNASASTYGSEATAFVSLANSYANKGKSYAATVKNGLKPIKTALVTKDNATRAANATKAHKLRVQMIQATHEAKQVANKATADMKNNKKAPREDSMQRAKIYVRSLTNQITKALKKGDANVVDGDLEELARIAKTLSDPMQDNKPASIKAGQKLGKDVEKADQARHNILTNPKAVEQLKLDLVPIQNDLHYVPNNQPAPKSLFYNDIGDGVINVLGEPIHAFTWTNLSGGYTKPVPVSWSGKFHKFDDFPVYDFVVLTPSSAVHQELAAYIKDSYNRSHNLRGFVGGGYRESAQQLIDRASDLDDSRIYLSGTSLVYPMEDGRKLHCPGYMTAAILAGIDASLPVGYTILNKEVGATSLDVNYSSNDLDALDRNGVIMVEPVMNRNATSEFVVGDDVSTDNTGTDPVQDELQLGEVTDFLFDDLRLWLQPELGTKVTAASASTIENSVRDFLDKNRALARGGGTGLIIDYDPDDVSCEIHNETARISFSCSPVFAVRHIFAKGDYNGYDEQVGQGTNNANYFTTPSGQLVPDQNAQTDEVQNGTADTGTGVSNENEESPD